MYRTSPLALKIDGKKFSPVSLPPQKSKDILKRIQKFKGIAKYKDVEGLKDEWYYQ